MTDDHRTVYVRTSEMWDEVQRGVASLSCGFQEQSVWTCKHAETAPSSMFLGLISPQILFLEFRNFFKDGLKKSVQDWVFWPFKFQVFNFFSLNVFLRLLKPPKAATGGVLKNFEKYTGKPLCFSLFSVRLRLETLLKKEALGVFQWILQSI